MGFAKRQMMEEEQRGWSGGPDRYVCGDCADDDFLAAKVGESATALKCDYCDRESESGAPIASHVNVLIELVARAVTEYWTDPAEVLPYESAEGGYQGKVIQTRELLADVIGMDWPEPLLDDVEAALILESWCERYPFQLSEEERLKFGWQDFERITKHQSRYACLLPPIDPDEATHPDDVPPSAMLGEVARCVLGAGLVQKLPVGTALFRARAHDPSRVPTTPAELGAPTAAQARYPNRMSAAGIPVFYGATDEDTALVETFDPDDDSRSMASIGAFQTVRELQVLNLCDPPDPPSYFDVDRATERASVWFLRSFVKSVSSKTVKDGREHIEYVPTQIFAEYVRFRMQSGAGAPIHGIIYPSSRIAGGRCVVLFCDQAACVPPTGEPWERREQWIAMTGPARVLDHDACVAVVLRETTVSLKTPPRRTDLES